MPDRARLLVVTDLDASLLDEHYRFDAARPALDSLRAGGHRLVLASSKTLAEMRALARELGLRSPIVAENGGVIAWPTPEGDWHPTTPAMHRHALLRHAHGWRTRHAGSFEGFSDWTDAQVRDHTGLDLDAAARARDRHATEPVVWQGSDEARQAFAATMADHGIRMVRGGRFWHLMGAADKADGLRAVRDHIRQHEPHTRWTTVAVGDSPNDVGMLEAADIAVVIPNPRNPEPLAVRAPRVLRAPAPGPTGWNATIGALLHDPPEADHG